MSTLVIWSCSQTQPEEDSSKSNSIHFLGLDSLMKFTVSYPARGFNNLAEYIITYQPRSN